MKAIIVRIDNKYGNRLVYPDCPTSQLLCQLTGKLTLSPKALELIEKLGYTIEVTTPDWKVGKPQ